MTAPSVDHFMKRKPYTIAATATLDDAHHLMRKHRIRHLPVISEGKLVGVVSVGDLYLMETLADVDPREVEVSETMSKKVYTVAPDDPLDKVAAKMAADRLGSAVVVEDDEVVGIFTTTDALRALFHVWKRPPP